MATTDANGQVFYGPTDPVEPLQGILNGVSTAVSSKLGAQSQIVRIPNVAGRAAAVTARAGRAITAADPLIVWRADAGAGRQIEYTINGTNWIATGDFTEHKNEGAPVSGIVIPGSSQNIVTPQTRTGKMNAVTSSAFGNEYAPTVTFTTPFPVGCTNVSVTQVFGNAGPHPYSGALAIDILDATRFRVVYVGAGSSPTHRAFLYHADGF